MVKFLINRRIRTHCELEGAVLSPEELAEYVKKTIHKNEMDFIFNLPFSGEYLLKIFVVDESEQNEKVCVYWLTDADDTKTREVRGSGWGGGGGGSGTMYSLFIKRSFYYKYDHVHDKTNKFTY